MMSENTPSFQLIFTRTPESLFTFKKFEALHDALVYKNSMLKRYTVFCVAIFMAAAITMVLLVPLAPWVLLGAGILYSIYFLYQYKVGYLSDYKLAKKNLQLTKEESEKREKEVTANFFSDHAYIGSFNENRLFYYKDLEFIQVIEDIVIFYLLPSDEKHLQDFSEFVVDLKDIDESKKEQFFQLISLIKKQYYVGELSELETLL